MWLLASCICLPSFLLLFVPASLLCVFCGGLSFSVPAYSTKVGSRTRRMGMTMFETINPALFEFVLLIRRLMVLFTKWFF